MKKYFIREVIQPDHAGGYPKDHLVEVPREIAEADTVNGFYALFLNTTGKQMSAYVNIAADTAFLSQLKVSKTALNDCMDVQLAVGDYVLTTLRKYADLKLCRVSAFTHTKVRVVPMIDTGNGSYVRSVDSTLKDTCDIVRVDSEMLL